MNAKITYYIVRHNADTTETGSTMNVSVALVKDIWDRNERQLKHLLHEKFGSPVAFVQGVAACDNYTYKEATLDEARQALAEGRKWGGWVSHGKVFGGRLRSGWGITDEEYREHSQSLTRDLKDAAGGLVGIEVEPLLELST